MARQALEAYNAMRRKEGEALAADLLSRKATILGYVEKVEARSAVTVAEYRNRLTNKLREVLENHTIDESRILTEAAIFADRVATDEETTRLSSHIKQFRSIIKSGEPAGRKLDFLTQELNREVNTVGSKANDIDIAKIVVDLKSEIEKIREQIQNVE